MRGLLLSIRHFKILAFSGQALIIVPAIEYPVSETHPLTHQQLSYPGQDLSNGVRKECVAIICTFVRWIGPHELGEE